MTEKWTFEMIDLWTFDLILDTRMCFWTVLRVMTISLRRMAVIRREP
jgi:hypothetical protein